MLDELRFFNEQVPWAAAAAAFVFGAITGSFLNVCIYRIPAGRSVITPGSRCSCGRPIAWYDNLPILSWFLLRGQARCCGAPFSFRYPFIEALTGALFLACWLVWPPGPALVGMVFCSILVCATFIDLDHMIIPDRFTIGAAVVGVGLSLLVPGLHLAETIGAPFDQLRSLRESILGLMVGSAVVLWIGLLAEVVLRREAMGFGDVKFLGAIGAFTGWQGALFALFGGAVLGTLAVAVVLFYRGVTGRKPAPAPPPGAENAPASGADAEPAPTGRETPFGPMLAAGALVYFLFLREPVDAYFALVAELF
ncbi:MAG: prepilin peptidase [Puniceicoccaceae bacterium]|nr:MAG: prepilin peptidase [Puniceicoccaceae bacterium]